MGLMKQYDGLIDTFIRPARMNYSTNNLGPFIFQVNNQNCKRVDFDLKNKSDKILKCSLFEIANSVKDKKPCIIYLHCNGGSRMESLPIVQYVLSKGMLLCSFDFSGSGVSEGEYVSLGVFETDDTLCVIDYLKQTNKVSQIGLWGRSMGGATAIRTAQMSTDVICLACDSPFSSMRQLAIDIARKHKKVPVFIIKIFLWFVKRSIRKKAKFDMGKLEIMGYAKQVKQPCLLGTSKDDTFVPSKHVMALYQELKGPKKLFQFTGEHNLSRTKPLYDEFSQFFYEQLCQQQQPQVQIGLNVEKNNNNRLDRPTNLESIELKTEFKY